jgi:hypothetical protein
LLFIPWACHSLEAVLDLATAHGKKTRIGRPLFEAVWRLLSQAFAAKHLLQGKFPLVRLQSQCR